MTQSGIWKIENADKETGKRRRITFDEAVAFARVFELSLEELSLPREVLEAERAADIARDMRSTIEAIENLNEHLNGLWRQFAAVLTECKADPLVYAAVARVSAEKPGDFDPWAQRPATSQRVTELKRLGRSTPIGESAAAVEQFLDEVEGRWRRLFDTTEESSGS